MSAPSLPIGAPGGDAAEWDRVYTLAATRPPARRVRLTVSRTLSFPYFNAGFIATKAPVGLSAQWQDVASLLDSESAGIENRYPWLDQISLAVVMQRTGSWRSLPEFYNFPAHLRALGDDEIGVCHYHYPTVILREPRLRALFDAAVREFPAISTIAARHASWLPLLTCRFANTTYRARTRNFLITGIPRSGTSYLASWLDGQADWLVINEPLEIFDHLQSRTDSSGIGMYHAECRERVLAGQPISNKIKDGRVIEDTAVVDQRESYHPVVSRSDFWLGSKNTLAYVAAMGYLIELGWPIIAMVRNPLDTLASWRNTFSHLAEARVANLPIANPAFPGWAAWQRESLLEIDAQSDSALRRVLLWRLLARTLLHHRNHLLLWRYEDLMANPAPLLDGFTEQVGYGLKIPAAGTNSRSRTADYDVDEREMLRDLCADEIAEFGYVI